MAANPNPRCQPSSSYELDLVTKLLVVLCSLCITIVLLEPDFVMTAVRHTFRNNFALPRRLVRQLVSATKSLLTSRYCRTILFADTRFMFYLAKSAVFVDYVVYVCISSCARNAIIAVRKQGIAPTSIARHLLTRIKICFAIIPVSFTTFLQTLFNDLQAWWNSRDMLGHIDHVFNAVMETLCYTLLPALDKIFKLLSAVSAPAGEWFVENFGVPAVLIAVFCWILWLVLTLTLLAYRAVHGFIVDQVRARHAAPPIPIHPSLACESKTRVGCRATPCAVDRLGQPLA